MSKKRELSKEEEILWKRAIRDVKPLEHQGVSPHLSTPKPKVREDSSPDVETTRRTFKVVYKTPKIFNKPTISHGKKLKKEMSSGNFNADAKIDLHGMTLISAKFTIRTLFEKLQEEGRRKILVITGHGEGDSTIQREFLFWLEEAPLKNMVLSCSQAHRRQGGEGAWYIILRKRS